jgi:hypothetical protein
MGDVSAVYTIVVRKHERKIPPAHFFFSWRVVLKWSMRV